MLGAVNFHWMVRTKGEIGLCDALNKNKIVILYQI